MLDLLESKKGKNLGGRPPFFENSEKGVQEMSELIDLYFEKCLEGTLERRPNKKTGKWEETKIPFTPSLEGMAIFLGFADRISLWEYSKKPRFANLLTRAKSVLGALTLHKGATGGIDPKIATMILARHHDYAVEPAGGILPGSGNLMGVVIQILKGDKEETAISVNIPQQIEENASK